MGKPINDATLSDEFKCFTLLLIEALLASHGRVYHELAVDLVNRKYEKENNQ